MLCLSVTLSSAQRNIRLEHEGSFPGSFGYVGGVRMLSNGRLLVADPLGQVLVSIDMDAGTADTLGRVGSGPQEYRQPDAVFPLPGDSTLLTDLGNGRLTAIAPGGMFGETSPISQEGSGGRLTIVLPRFVDAVGRIYYEPETFTAGGPADSAAILRFDRSTGAVDTMGPVMLSQASQRRVGARVMMSRGPLRLRDDWAVGLDGRVAIVHAMDFSVEWVSPDGQAVRGRSHDYERFQVRRAEQEEWLDNQAVEAINVRAMMSPSGERSMQFSRGGGGGPGRGIDADEWPDELPPFRTRRSRVAPNGELWVERYVTAAAAPAIDVFNERGIKSGEITLPQGRRVVGFGDGVVFLVYTDDVGLQWVERYRIVR
jgi:hypothetical protein